MYVNILFVTVSSITEQELTRPQTPLRFLGDEQETESAVQQAQNTTGTVLQPKRGLGTRQGQEGIKGHVLLPAGRREGGGGVLKKIRCDLQGK